MSFDKAIDNLQKRVTVLEEKQKILVEAIKYYADDLLYAGGSQSEACGNDRGDVARKALKQCL